MTYPLLPNFLAKFFSLSCLTLFLEHTNCSGRKMSRSIARSWAVSLLFALSCTVLIDSANAGVIQQRHSSSNGAKFPSYLQSVWHTRNLDAPKMSAEEAMAYYFPHMNEGCSTGMGGNGGGDGGSSSGGGNGGSGGGGSGNGTSGGNSTVDYALRNYNTISGVYNLTVYPKNLPLFLNETDIGLPFFNENVTGRVTPLGNFSGYEDNIEYFWGLAPVPVDPSTAAISQAVVTQFSSGCPEVAASTVELTVTNVVGPNNGTFITKLKERAFWRFDSNGLIIAYDAWIPNLQQFVGKLDEPSVAIYPGGAYSPNATSQAVTEAQICELQAEFCTGDNQVYDSVNDCLGTLQSKTYGTYDETWGDNVPCRRIHVLLTPIRPAVRSGYNITIACLLTFVVGSLRSCRPHRRWQMRRRRLQRRLF